ncbi:MAG: Ltp family lipoprotein [Actinobacteria bacterium]|nr:Ltp family lipoprotein [Actinomycetota bacterium]
MRGFSRQRLIDQLSSQHGDQFTVSQAAYARSRLASDDDSCAHNPILAGALPDGLATETTERVRVAQCRVVVVPK